MDKKICIKQMRAITQSIHILLLICTRDAETATKEFPLMDNIVMISCNL